MRRPWWFLICNLIYIWHKSNKVLFVWACGARGGNESLVMMNLFGWWCWWLLLVSLPSCCLELSFGLMSHLYSCWKIISAATIINDSIQFQMLFQVCFSVSSTVNIWRLRLNIRLTACHHIILSGLVFLFTDVLVNLLTHCVNICRRHARLCSSHVKMLFSLFRVWGHRSLNPWFSFILKHLIYLLLECMKALILPVR